MAADTVLVEDMDIYDYKVVTTGGKQLKNRLSTFREGEGGHAPRSIDWAQALATVAEPYFNEGCKVEEPEEGEHAFINIGK